jgi:integrase
MAVYQKRGDWWIDFYYQGRRYRQKIGTRKKDAEQALSQIKVKIASGEFVPLEERRRQESMRPEHVLFEAFAKDEFLPWSEMEHSTRHHVRLESIIRVHLASYFGKRYLHEITSKHIEDYKKMRSRAGYRRGKQIRQVSNATINREVCCIKVLLRKAEEWGRLTESPARRVRTLKETPKSPYLLEQEEVASLLEELPDHLKALIACAVYAGLRRSELFHLRWEDINWRTGELAVVSRQEHHTKNYQSRRIPMSDSLTEALRRHPRHLNSPYVFCNREGKPYNNIKKALNNAAERAEIDGSVRMHQLRHAFCSHALMQGIDPRTVQKWMGHKDLKTTLRYAHVSPDHERAAIQRLQYHHGHQVDTKSGEA